MATTSISWADKVWNPTLGCTRQSSGCEHCYAEQFAHRLSAMHRDAMSPYHGLTVKHADGSVNWTGKVRLMNDRLDDPLRWKKPARIFVDSMSDLFHPDVPDAYLDQVFRTMATARQHTFMVLTKRPSRMREYVGERWSLAHQEPWAPLPNVWLGTSTENQQTADLRIPELLATPAAVRFISAEPLLGPIDITKWLKRTDPASVHYQFSKEPIHPETAEALVELAAHLVDLWLPRLDWVIVGAESGEGRRPYELDWARSIRDQCRSAGVTFFYKQGPGRYPGMDPVLDGQEWHQFPSQP